MNITCYNMIMTKTKFMRKKNKKKKNQKKETKTKQWKNSWLSIYSNINIGQKSLNTITISNKEDHKTDSEQLYENHNNNDNNSNNSTNSKKPPAPPEKQLQRKNKHVTFKNSKTRNKKTKSTRPPKRQRRKRARAQRTNEIDHDDAYDELTHVLTPSSNINFNKPAFEKRGNASAVSAIYGEKMASVFSMLHLKGTNNNDSINTIQSSSDPSFHGVQLEGQLSSRRNPKLANNESNVNTINININNGSEHNSDKHNSNITKNMNMNMTMNSNINGNGTENSSIISIASSGGYESSLLFDDYDHDHDSHMDMEMEAEAQAQAQTHAQAQSQSQQKPLTLIHKRQATAELYPSHNIQNSITRSRHMTFNYSTGIRTPITASAAPARGSPNLFQHGAWSSIVIPLKGGGGNSQSIDYNMSNNSYSVTSNNNSLFSKHGHKNSASHRENIYNQSNYRYGISYANTYGTMYIMPPAISSANDKTMRDTTDADESSAAVFGDNHNTNYINSNVSEEKIVDNIDQETGTSSTNNNKGKKSMFASLSAGRQQSTVESGVPLLSQQNVNIVAAASNSRSKSKSKQKHITE